MPLTGFDGCLNNFTSVSLVILMPDQATTGYQGRRGTHSPGMRELKALVSWAGSTEKLGISIC